MGSPRQSQDGGEGMVLLRAQGPQVPDGDPHQPGHQKRLLEGHRQGQGDLPRRRPRRHEEDARLLHRARPARREDAMGDARVPPRGQAAAQSPPRRQGRMGRLPRVQQRLGGQGWPANGAAARRPGAAHLPLRRLGRHPRRRDAAAHGRLPRLEGRRKFQLRRRPCGGSQGGAAEPGGGGPGPQLLLAAEHRRGPDHTGQREGAGAGEPVPGVGRAAR